MLKIRTALVAVVSAVALFAAGSALAVSGAANTTDDPANGHFCLHGPNSDMNPADSPAVDCNAYTAKTDVYINGGPTNGQSTLSDGYWLFAVLNPGGQNDPNDGAADNLSDAANGGGGDAASNRVYHVTGGQIDSYGGTHATDSTYQATDGLLIGLAPFDDTSNPGGVYILASCFLGSSSAVTTVNPSDCKYDAFRVTGPNPPSGGVDLVGTKTASGSFMRTFTWSTQKDVTPTYVQTSSNTVAANYTVAFTKSAGVDSGFTVSGQVMVFNSNDTDVTGVSVTDAIGVTPCTVTGGSDTIAAGDSATFDYTCSVADASSGTNTATINWDASSIDSPDDSTTATADFSFGDPTLVGDCTTVTDTLAPTQVMGTICASKTFTYTLTLNVPASGCTTYDNTASETTSGTSDMASVEVCRTNSNGFTIGYWQNKNGQAYIQAHAAALCTYLMSYSNILTGLPSCAGTNIAGNNTKAGSLAKYVYDTIKAANSAGDGLLMLRAQFLATAINVFQTPSLGTTNITLSSSQQTELSLGACSSVNSVLSAENSRYSTYSATKSIVVDLQTLDNNINNNNQLTC